MNFSIKKGRTVSIDLHGYSVAEARAKLLQLLKTSAKDVTEIEVIHGYHGGDAIQKMVRFDLKHARILRREFGLQHGITILILK